MEPWSWLHVSKEWIKFKVSWNEKIICSFARLLVRVKSCHYPRRLLFNNLSMPSFELLSSSFSLFPMISKNPRYRSKPPYISHPHLGRTRPRVNLKYFYPRQEKHSSLQRNRINSLTFKIQERRLMFNFERILS